MFYYTYKIIILKGSLAGHYYYGKHKTNNLNDGYAGSGKIVKSYYKKYGKIEGITYIKSILQFYNSLEELNLAEEILIGDRYNTDPLCLNLIPSGTGKDRNKGYKHSIETKRKISDYHKGIVFSEEHRKNISDSKKGKRKEKHSEETKQKISESHKGLVLSAETKKKISEAKKGHIPCNKGLKLTKNNKNDAN